jgi:hypothetical protein
VASEKSARREFGSVHERRPRRRRRCTISFVGEQRDERLLSERELASAPIALRIAGSSCICSMSKRARHSIFIGLRESKAVVFEWIVQHVS